MKKEIYDFATLPNGLRMIHLQIDSSVSYAGFAVQAGTRDEAEDEYGLAHFVEHMLFKGTDRRKSWHILNRMERVGGELNAYTTKEETFIYSVFMEEHFVRALDLLSDLVFHANFPETEIDKEREVILDELNSYKDDPAELIFDEFENILYDGHSLGHAILGTEASLRMFGPSSGRSFTDRYYQPENMVFFSMGRRPFGQVRKEVEKYVGGLADHVLHPVRRKPTVYNPQSIRKKKETHQAHVLLGGRSYGLYDEKRIPFYLLNNMLGGPGMNSRLNVSLRERKGLVYTVESNVTSYTDTGVFSIYFGTDPKQVDKALSLVSKELKSLREKRLTDGQLAAAKKQLVGQFGVSSDNREGTFLNLGKSYLYYDRYDSLPEVIAQIEQVSGSDLLEVANEVLAPEALSRLIYY